MLMVAPAAIINKYIPIKEEWNSPSVFVQPSFLNTGGTIQASPIKDQTKTAEISTLLIIFGIKGLINNKTKIQ